MVKYIQIKLYKYMETNDRKRTSGQDQKKT